MTPKQSAGFLIAALAVLVCALGVAVMAAWRTHEASLVQINPEFVPMQFNTALCLALSGLSLLLAKTKGLGRRVSILCAVAIGFFSAIAGLQYLFHSDWAGLDRFFMQPYITTKTLYPGRMAPNTAFCFILHSLSLLSWHFLRKNESNLFVIIVPDTIVLLLNSFAFTGYFFHTEMAYSWWGGGHIAPHTAFGLVASSIAFLLLAIDGSLDIKAKLFPRWQSALTAALGIAVTILIGEGVFSSVQRNAVNAAETDLARTAQVVQMELNNTISALNRMSYRLNSSEPMPAWLNDAVHYHQDDPTYNAFAVTDDRQNIVKSVPEGSPALWNDRDVKQKLDMFLKDRRTPFIFDPSHQISSPFIILGFPIYNDREFRGFLLINYSLKSKLDYISRQLQGDYYLTLTDKDGLYFSDTPPQKIPWKIEKTIPLTVLGQELLLTLAVDASRYQDESLFLFILIAGAVLSLLLAYATWQNNKIRAYADDLATSDERYAFALEAAGVGLWDWDREQDKVIWGANSWRIFGARSNDEIVETAFEARKMIPESDLVIIDQQMADALAANKGFSIEYRMRTLDGRDIWVQSRGKAIIVRDGAPVRVSGTLTDITERKEGESELLRSNEELEKFAYVASHDLKAPLRNIDDLARWVIEDYRDILPDDAREKLDLLGRRVHDLETLLNDILAYSRAGRITENPVEVDVGDMVERLAQIHVPDAFEFKIAGKIPVIVTPQTPLEQVFSNLLTNAVKHHDRGKGKIEVECIANGNSYEFIVRDDGPGIPPEFHDRVFQMFQTLKSRDKVAGSGLGMAIIKKLVEWRGGRVWIESDGRGTSVHFLWPSL